MLVLGKSGTGKTSAIPQLAQMLDLCVVIEDASLFTGAGWKGREVSSIVKDVVTSAESKIHSNYAIVVLDETDKMVTNQSPHSSFSMINNLLKMMEGAEIVHEEGNKTWRMDTSNLLFICLGAFDGLENIILNRLNKGKKLGFRTENKRFIPDNIFSLAERQDLLHYGMNTQFLGRVAMITATNELREPALEKILMSSDLSVVTQFDSLLYAALVIKVSITKNVAKEIAKGAYQSGTGARALLYELTDKLKAALYFVDLKKTYEIKLDYFPDEKKMILKYQENERKCKTISLEKRLPIKQMREDLIAIPLDLEQYNFPSVLQYAEMVAEQFYIENSQASITYSYPYVFQVFFPDLFSTLT